MITKIGIYRDPRNKGRPWVCRWFTVADPETGRRRRFSKAFEFKRDAERFARDKDKEFEDQGRPLANPEKRTLESFLKDYLRRRKPELKPASLELYEGTAKRLVDFFGRDCPLYDITMERAQDFILAQKTIAAGREGLKLSDWTREQLKRHCRTFFTTALEWGYLQRNPFIAKALKGKRLTARPWYRMKPDEYHALLEATPSLREKVAYALFYTAGLRLHEAVNLTWDCLDFQKNLLFVMNREPRQDIPPFSIKDHEERRIPLPAHTIDLLTQWQTEAPEGVPFVLLTADRFETVKAKWQKVRVAGSPWKNRYMVNNVLRNFKSHVKRAGIQPVGKFTVHTLRKCAGQNWADALPMNVVKEFMGHSSIATTQEFYSTVDRDHEKKAAESVQRLLETGFPAEQSDVQVTYEGNLA
jgi:integrase